MDNCIIIPTIRRSHKLARLNESIITNAGVPLSIYYVVDSKDIDSIGVIQSIMESNKDVHLILTSEKGSAACVNVGYQNSTEEFVFSGTDDLEYTKDFYKLALEDIGDYPCLAMADTESRSWCIFLVKRSYGSFVEDMPNSIFHPGYDRIADSEFVFTMKNRGKLKYSKLTLSHKSPVFYGIKKKNEQGIYQSEIKQIAIREHMIPHSKVTVEFVKNPTTGVNDIILIKLYPLNPLEEDFTEYSDEKYKADCEILKSRAHLWGGQVCHEDYLKCIDAV